MHLKSNKRAENGSKLLQKFQNIKKTKFYFYSYLNKSSSQKDILVERVQQCGGENMPTFYKSVNFLVVPDAVFSLTNSQLLKDDWDFAESVEQSSKHCSAKSSAEKSLTNIRRNCNDRSFRFLSSSTSFAHNPKVFEKQLCKTPQKKNKRDDSSNNTPVAKIDSSYLRTPENQQKTPERYSDPKEYKYKEDFKNLFEFLNCKRWNILTYSALGQKLDILQSDFVDWHIDRGFRPFCKEAAHMVLTAFSSNIKRSNRQHSHTFAYIIKSKSYDVHKTNLEAPDGTSIFQTESEHIKSVNNYAMLMNKYQGQVFNLKKAKETKTEFLEQEPVQNKFCTICGANYVSIHKHLKDEEHISRIDDYKEDYDTIDKLCSELDMDKLLSIKTVEKFVPAKPYENIIMEESKSMMSVDPVQKVCILKIQYHLILFFRVTKD